jgi:Diaphanous GTPase-binding Domain
MFQLSFTGDEEELRARTRQMDALKTALRTQPHSFVLKFVEQGGLEALLDFLGNLDHETKQSPLHTTLIGCLKALMNNSVSKFKYIYFFHLFNSGNNFITEWQSACVGPPYGNLHGCPKSAL